MNIMLFSRICAKTGVGNHMNQLANELVAQGHSVWVLSSTNEQGIEDSPFCNQESAGFFEKLNFAASNCKRK